MTELVIIISIPATLSSSEKFRRNEVKKKNLINIKIERIRLPFKRKLKR